MRRALLFRVRRGKVRTLSNYYPKRWRPSSTDRLALSAQQLRTLRDLGYTGPSHLYEDEAAALIRLYRNGQGARKRW